MPFDDFGHSGEVEYLRHIGKGSNRIGMSVSIMEFIDEVRNQLRIIGYIQLISKMVQTVDG